MEGRRHTGPAPLWFSRKDEQTYIISQIFQNFTLASEWCKGLRVWVLPHKRRSKWKKGHTGPCHTPNYLSRRALQHIPRWGPKTFSCARYSPGKVEKSPPPKKKIESPIQGLSSGSSITYSEPGTWWLTVFDLRLQKRFAIEQNFFARRDRLDGIQRPKLRGGR